MFKTIWILVTKGIRNNNSGSTSPVLKEGRPTDGVPNVEGLQVLGHLSAVGEAGMDIGEVHLDHQVHVTCTTNPPDVIGLKNMVRFIIYHFRRKLKVLF